MYGLVTYDLDVAKTAHRIQITSQLEFEKLFVMFGVFHSLMCFFRAIGKAIAESGGPAMLTDSGVLAPGSLRGFVEWLSYNRCKRLHPMLALALETLLFRRFMMDYENSDLVQLELQNVHLDTKEAVDRICHSALFLELFLSSRSALKVETLVEQHSFGQCTFGTYSSTTSSNGQ